MPKFKQRSNAKSGFKMLGSSSPNKLTTIEKLNSPNYVEGTRTDPYWSKNPHFRSHRNMTEMPDSDYEGMTQDWNQNQYDANNPATWATEYLRRDNFERNKRGKLTRRGRQQKKEHEAFLKRRAANPLSSDLKQDRSKPQLLARHRKRGYSQVQDPFGNWHIMNRQGNLVGSSFGYSAESKAWRNKMSLNPAYDPNADNVNEDGTITFDPNVLDETNEISNDQATADIIETDNNNDQDNVQNATVTTEPGGGTTVKDDDTGEVVQDNYIPGDDVHNPVEENNIEEADESGESSSFAEAFQAARERGDKTFEFDGKQYHSRQADETPEDWKAKMEEINPDDTSMPGGALRGDQPDFTGEKNFENKAYLEDRIKSGEATDEEKSEYINTYSENYLGTEEDGVTEGTEFESIEKAVSDDTPDDTSSDDDSGDDDDDN